MPEDTRVCDQMEIHDHRPSFVYVFLCSVGRHDCDSRIGRVVGHTHKRSHISGLANELLRCY